jgi:AcrR family transcriptional regulator
MFGCHTIMGHLLASRHAVASPPRHAARATREAGRHTRAELLHAASALFSERGLAGVSMAEIAEMANCFPSQVTYYFGDKESLFVEAACRDIFVVRSAVERAARRAGSPEAAVKAMVRATRTSPAVLGFIEAMLLVRRRPDLAPQVQAAWDALHAESERAATGVLSQHGWATPAGPAIQSRAFWSTIIGITLERAATDDRFDEAKAELVVRSVLNFSLEQPTSPKSRKTAKRR